MNPLQKKRSGFFYKQLIAIVGINILTLFIMSGLLFSNFIAAYEDNLKEVMRSKITLLAATSASALVFGDQESAATS